MADSIFTRKSRDGGTLETRWLVTRRSGGWLAVYATWADLADGDGRWRLTISAPAPSAQQLRDALCDLTDEVTAERIKQGFKDDGGNAVWLSTENQLNWSALAADTSAVTWPLTLKTGEDDDGGAVMREFASADEFAEFWNGCRSWILSCLASGWADKAEITSTRAAEMAAALK